MNDKLERQDKEIRRLKKLMKNIDKDTMQAVSVLIKNVAFMSTTLDDLQESINNNGVVSEYQNGENQWGTKKSPEVDIYNVLIKNYMQALKQLVDLLPERENTTKKDALLEFLKK